MSTDRSSVERRIAILVSRLTRRDKQILAICFDAVALPFALWSALVLRLGEWNFDVSLYWPAFLVSSFISIPVFAYLGLYRHVVRHIGTRAVWAVIQGASITALSVASIAYMVPLIGFPRSVPVIFWLLALLYVGGTRFTVRAYFQWLQKGVKAGKPIIIYGASETGAQLARQLRQHSEFHPVAFLDDDRSLQKRFIDGLYVYPPRALDKLMKEISVREIFISVDSTRIAKRRRIIEFLESYSIRVRLIPDILEIASDHQSLVNIRDVRIEDILQRDQIRPLPSLLSGSARNRVVMVTGAGGSIGSELCRQIIRQKPASLLLLDQSEFALYEVEREIKAICEKEQLPVVVMPLLGSISNQVFVDTIFSKNNVETIYHAAAYKHVGLVEENVVEGLRNNTIGAFYVAKAALSFGVKNFIFISTDKAVRTQSVMGASKRLAEMMLQGLQGTSERTIFSMVRFGNVLGSSGSVVPLFLDQIDSGGPVTVTHPEVSRYFMTIPEAAELVMQAASMAEGGDIFVLDMGKPTKIMELAERMIRLKGYTVRDADNPSGDIEIKISGLKSGEKLHEELLVGDQIFSTSHRKIMRVNEESISWQELAEYLSAIEAACESSDDYAIRVLLKDLFDISV